MDDNTFKKLRTMLDDLTVIYGLETEWRGSNKDKENPRKEHFLNIFRTIAPPWTNNDWCHVCRTEGDSYVGGCCGTMSALQDIVEQWFRFDYFVPIASLAEVADLFVAHGDDEWKHAENLEEVETLYQEQVDSFAGLDPWEKLRLVWKIVSLSYVPEFPKVRNYDNKEDIVKTANLVSSLALQVAFSCTFFKNEANTTGQHEAQNALAFARLRPAIYALCEAIEEAESSSVDHFEGYAIYDKIDKEVAKNRYGYCFYWEKEEAERLLELFRSHEKQLKEEERKYYPIDERLEIRKVKITLQEGIVFLDE